MAHLAIQGHATRGNEVIALLEMLGGKNCHSYTGTNEDYYIIDNGRICKVPHCVCVINQWTMYSLDDFLKKYPYKVGDKVITNDCDVCKIHSMYWDRGLNRISYILETPIGLSKGWGVNELQPFEKKESMEEKKINQMSLANCDLDEVEIVLGDKFELKIKDGKYYAVCKKPQCPTNYIDACSVLDISVTHRCEMDVEVYGDELYALYQLLVCRNAYWKIAGDWKPDWENPVHNKWFYANINKGNLRYESHLLVFPTAEIRDAFYENFKDLIKQCKELL